MNITGQVSVLMDLNPWKVMYHGQYKKSKHGQAHWIGHCECRQQANNKKSEVAFISSFIEHILSAYYIQGMC